MGSFKNYEPLHKDGTDYNTCKYLNNEVCCNVECEWLADYPNSKELCNINSKRRCKYFKEEKEDE